MTGITIFLENMREAISTIRNTTAISIGRLLNTTGVISFICGVITGRKDRISASEVLPAAI